MFSSTTRSVVAVAGLAMATASLAACAPSSSSAHGLSVVATTTQICDYVTQIAARSADISLNKTDAAGKNSHVGAAPEGAALTMSLTCLLAPNASAHEHEMTPAQTSALAQADVMAISGVDLEHFLDDAVASSGFHGRMVVTSGVLTAADVDNPGAPDPDGAYTIDRGNQRVDVAPWPFPPEEAGEEPEFRFDPHVWTSPKGARVQVANLGAGLAAAAPDAALSINAATASYLEDIDALDEWTAEAITTVPEGQRVLFTSHDAFGYFANAYDVKFIGAALSDFNHQQDATAEHINKAAEEVKASGAKALFAENSNNSKSIEAIARAAGVKAITNDDALYGDSLGPAGSPGETYIGSIIHNVTTLVTAWDGTPAPLPPEISNNAK